MTTRRHFVRAAGRPAVNGSTPAGMEASQRAGFTRYGPLVKRVGFTAKS